MSIGSWRGARDSRPESWITLAVVGTASVYVFWRLNPRLIFTDTLPAGGDMGAHTWAPAYLRDQVLPNLRLDGWTDDWYSGFPAFRFYMVVPYLAIVLLDVVLPYGVAFKLVAVSGVVSIPISAWAFGRLAGFRFPIPPLFSVAALFFVFDPNFTIYGGNIASTLAGEFAFSISLSLALVYLGLVARGLESGDHRGLAAVVLALCGLCHLIPAIFAICVTALLVLARSLTRLPRPVGWAMGGLGALAFAIFVGSDYSETAATVGRSIAVVVVAVALGLLVAYDLRRVWWVATMGAVAGMLAAFWVLPFYWRRGYLNDMGWEKINQVRENLFFPDKVSIAPFLVLAAIGAITAIVRWRPVGVALVGTAVLAAFGFVLWPQHRLWNARLLPFWYLAIYLLAAIGVALLFEYGARMAEWLLAGRRAQRGDFVDPHNKRISSTTRLVAPLLMLSVALISIGLYLHVLPNGERGVDSQGAGEFRWGPFTVADADRNFSSDWARWNFTGYERKSAYAEYYDIVQTMATVGETRGCGRSLWEYGREQLDRYGTPMALMLLPHFSDRCIGSLEGLYFESSHTVGLHFLMQSELSQEPSRPMRDIPYSDFDIDLGVQHLQLMGVRYYLAFNEESVRDAALHPELTVIGASGPWTIFEVANSEVVTPLEFEPVVVSGLGEAGRDWIDPSVERFNASPRARDVLLAPHGPEHWARVELVDSPTPRYPLDPVEVTDIVVEDEKVSFRVDRTGVPVLVKVSYFPNWQVSGAQGPWRVTPNLMVVIPTDNEVELTYGRTPVELAGYGLSIIGLIAVIYLLRVAPVGFENRRRARAELQEALSLDGGRDAVEAMRLDDLLLPGNDDAP